MSLAISSRLRACTPTYLLKLPHRCPCRLRYHVLGTPQAQDPTVLAIPEHNEWMMGAEVSHDGRFLIISVASGCEPTNRLWYVPLEAIPKDPATGALDFSECDFHKGSKPLPLVKLVDDFSASFDYIGSSEDGAWTLMTNLDAPRYRLVRVNVAANKPAPPSEWESILEQHPTDLLQWAAQLAGGAMAVHYLRDVKSVLQLRDFASGQLTQELPLPGIGSIGFSGSHHHSEFFFSFTSFTDPGSQFKVDASQPDAAPELFRRITTKFNPDDFITRQVFVTSQDGTQVPMFLTHKKDLVLPNADSPALLYGYGGFNISLMPSFSVSRVAWLLAYNGVLAIANLRGGGEYGVDWRDGGSLGNKQNTFDDMQACAAWLHAENYCTPERTAIQGGSNGGLLVAACLQQRPDLFACGLAQVGVHDMLRFKR